MRFKAAMAQIRVESGQPEANMDRAVARIREAARQGCRLGPSYAVFTR